MKIVTRALMISSNKDVRASTSWPTTWLNVCFFAIIFFIIQILGFQELFFELQFLSLGWHNYRFLVIGQILWMVFSLSWILGSYSMIHLFYNLQLFYWHFLEILWLFIFLVFYVCSFLFHVKLRDLHSWFSSLIGIFWILGFWKRWLIIGFLNYWLSG